MSFPDCPAIRSYTKYFLLLLLLALPFLGIGQNDSSRVKNEFIRAGYIANTDTLISIKLNVNNEYEYFRQQGDNFLHDLRPNISLSSRFAFSYRFISFGIGFTPKFIPGNNDDIKQGKTKSIALGFAINTSHFIQDVQFVKVQGFYLHNSADYISGWDQSRDPFIQLPNIVIASLGGTTSYKFNPNFSLKAVSSQSEIQLKSCGSFIPSISYNLYQIDNQDPSASQQQSQKSSNFELLVNAGYFYTFVLKEKLYLSAGVIPGIGFNHTQLTSRLLTGNVNSSYNDLVFRSREKIGLGYNSRKLFAGGEFSIANSFRNMNHSNVQVEATRIYFQVFVGYRFTAPRFIRHETDVVKKAVPTKFQKLLE